MKTFLKNLSSFIFIVSLLSIIPAAQAAGLVPCNGPDCTVCHVFKLVVNITEFLFKQVALPLAGLMFLVGGIIMMLSAGSEARYKKGKDILINTLIGLDIVLAAFAIVNTLIMFFADGTIANGWWRVCQ